MVKADLKASSSLVVAFVLVAASVFFGAPGAFGQDLGDLSQWSESSDRQAGTRQTLKIGDAEYGFCWIPAGEFDMGSPESEENRVEIEKLHRVKLTRGFWTLETETTQALYQEVMGTNPSDSQGDDLPVETVSWDDATKFCEELTKRLPKGLMATLPTEAQWEYACRAGTKTAYSYGDSPDPGKMNYDSGESTPVKTFAPNPWGLYDMHGNVFEWTSDRLGSYPAGTAVDPKGPDDASRHVMRGGGWNFGNPVFCRSAARFGFPDDDGGDGVGFRFLLICD